MSLDLTNTHDPYSTHLSVLHALGAALRIEQVLELGAGYYSTPMFLNRKYFPHLKTLVSDEPNNEWREKVRRQIGSDRRWMLVSMPTEGVIADLSWYDLIFIDSGETEADRVPVIEAVAK